MSLVVTRTAAVTMIETLFGKTPVRELVLRLYRNDREPSDSDTEKSFVEANFLGYEPQHLSRWKLGSSDPPTLVHPLVEFRSSTGQRDQFIFGYYVTRADDGGLFWAERFPLGPYPMSVAGDRIQVVPKFALE